MYAQSIPSPNHHLHNPPSNQHQILAFYPKSKSWFFNSSKRVSISRMSSRNSGHMGLIECGRLHISQEHKQEDNRDDGFYMRRCVELARTAIGCTSPNPMVGCVIVKDGKIVGEGFHPKAGQPHAEVFALRDAGDLAENGTAYVSLEPCNHYGRTPPCTEALIKAKVRKVVVGMVDPNPIVASTGVKKLQDAGIEVTVGVEEEMCKTLNEAYIHQMLTGKPFVTLRYSISLDGHLLNQLGEGAIECGGYYSKLLQEYDAIMLSSNSMADKSSFLVSKEVGAKQPLNIVISKSPNSVMISERSTSIEAKKGREGTQVVSFDRISLIEILKLCKNRGLCSLLLDLNGAHVDFEDIVKECFEHNLFQKVVVEVLPVLGGDRETMLNVTDLKVDVKKLMSSRVSGKSVILEGYL